MSSPSRLPFVRGSSQRRPLSMIQGPDTSSNIPSFPIPIEEPTMSSRSNQKAKRLSFLPQFSRKSSHDDRVADLLEAAPTEDVENNSERGTDAVGGDAATEASARQDRSAMAPPASRLSRLSRPRPVSMMPTANGSSVGRPHTPLHAKTNSQELGDHREPIVVPERAADELSGHSSSVTVDNALQRPGSMGPPQTPRPTIPSRTTSVKPRVGESRLTSSVVGPAHAKTNSVSSQRSPTKIASARDRTNSSSTTASLSVSGGRTAAAERGSSSVQSKAASGLSGAALHTRNTSTNTISRTSPPRASVTSRARPASMLVAPTMKPAFSTYQQHYSPAKSALPKPPVPSARTSSTRPTATASTPANAQAIDVYGDFEVVKQQIELLQLALLHDASAQSHNEYSASAKAKLGRKHEQLASEYDDVRLGELHHQRADNLTALERWCPDRSLLVENLQILSMVYSDLSSLSEPGSRHQDVVTRFEAWMKEVESPLSTSATFVQPLGDEWKNAHGSVTLKLRSIQRNLNVLPPAPSEEVGAGRSALSVVLKACRELVEDGLRELEIMAKVEREVLARERMRVEEEAKDVAQMDVGEMALQWTPAWQKVS